MKASHLLTIGRAQDLKKLDDLPRGLTRRIGLVGRSNVGKSSLLNELLEDRLARISKQPGKTQSLHLYHWPKAELILVDLPGYGYARVSHSKREFWGGLIEQYLKKDRTLHHVLVLLDSRHGPSSEDLQTFQYLLRIGKEPIWVMSKADAIKNQKEKAARKKEVSEVCRQVGYNGEVFWVSSQTGAGLAELVAFLKEVGRQTGE